MKKFIKRLVVKFFTFIARKSLGDQQADIKVNRFSYFTKKTTVGKNLHFNGFRVYGEGKCHIGSNFHSGFGCSVLTSNHNFNGTAIPYDNTHIVKDVTIEDNVWFGINVIVCPGVTIGEGSIIQAGSVVVKSIPPLSIAGGAPATVFSNRDKEHYYRLKKQSKFN
ncbi:acyltransferase [Nonlabens tegetincola]|uniref:acyltransferase n=1 Tax=Nonlabens tegetincola TaxID=323273 RepID=UPI0005A840B9|nr:acyltransferase [Nonlabens tegetincola]